MASPKSSKKKIVGKLRLHVEAGKVTPGPPIGPALGQRQLNIMEFCKLVNEKIKALGLENGARVPVDIVYYSDKSFVVSLKRPTMTYLIKSKTGCSKGAKTPNKGSDFGQVITMAQCEEIAVVKMPDLNTQDLKSALNIVVGSARSMGFKVIESN